MFEGTNTIRFVEEADYKNGNVNTAQKEYIDMSVGNIYYAVITISFSLKKAGDEIGEAI